MSTDVVVPWPPAFFELGGEHITSDRNKGQNSWYTRGQNFVVVVTWAADGEVLHEPAAPDEHAILVPEGGGVEVVHEDRECVEVTGPALVVAPPGEIEVTVRRAGFVVRVFTSRGEVVAKAINHASYATANPRVSHLPEVPTPAAAAGPRVISLAGAIETAGRTYRTDSLMITWYTPVEGPQDTDDVSARQYDDLEQASLTLTGDYVHHVRRPWTTRMRDWRPDEHVQVTSPSVAVFAPGNVHVSRGVGPGSHQRIDVFAPPRRALVERGRVLNQSDYEHETGD